MARSCNPAITRFLVLSTALLAPPLVSAQISLRPTPAPSVTAESASWYQDREPIVFNGVLFYPSGPQVFFNGNEMVFSGVYRGVPLYTRTTLETNSYVFVPLSGGLMLPYERRRTGELAGTVGSSAPSFPVDREAEPPVDLYESIAQAPGPPTNVRPVPLTPPDFDARPRPLPRPIATTGRAEPMPAPVQPPRVPTRTRASVNGVYIKFDGSIWVSSGSPVRYDRARFETLGQYDNRPVYRDRSVAHTVFVPIPESEGTLLAPYSLKR